MNRRQAAKLLVLGSASFFFGTKLAAHPRSAEAGGIGTVVYKRDASAPLFYCTIDDCWDDSQVVRALDIARRNNVKLSFGPVGVKIKQNPGLWKDVTAQGHYVFNHTYNHPKLSTLSNQGIRDEITSARNALWEAVGFEYPQQDIRPPYGDGVFRSDARIPTICAELGLDILMWSVDSNGWKMGNRTDRAALNYVWSNIQVAPGNIVLQHAVPADIAVLSDLIKTAIDQGLTCRPFRDITPAGKPAQPAPSAPTPKPPAQTPQPLPVTPPPSETPPSAPAVPIPDWFKKYLQQHQ